MDQYERLQNWAVLIALLLIVINVATGLITGFNWWQAPFFLLAAWVLFVGGDLAGRHRRW